MVWASLIVSQASGGFAETLLIYWGLVQLAERQILTLEVEGSSPSPPAKQYHFLGTAVRILIYERLVRRPLVLEYYHTRDRSSMCWKKKDANGEITKTFQSSILV